MEYSHLRPSALKKPLFLTKGGLDNLRKRLDALMRERLEAVNRMRTMNQADKDPLALIDEVRRLETAEAEVININSILAHAEPVVSQKDPNKILVGSTVTLQNDQGNVVYTIVCPLEVDLEAHKISEESPLGKMLLDKQLHDTVSVPNRKGKDVHYKIVSIE
jgi:transcription elongation factor GreA